MVSSCERLRALAEEWDLREARDLRAQVRERGCTSEGAECLAMVLGVAYPAMRGAIFRHLGDLAVIAQEGWTTPRTRLQTYRRLLAACSPAGTDETRLDGSAVRAGLRRASAVERLRIALRELDADIDVDVTAREWSALAEAQLEIALREARDYVERRYGPIRTGDGSRNGFCILGLGKLGGHELNAGSDIDIMFVHESDEGWASKVGPTHVDALTPFDAFTMIARRLVATLEAHDETGFCARVDLRLRPEGSSGPLSNSIVSSLSYYETFGRGWERAAMLRARPVAGDLGVGTRLLEELTPFVYRRTVDPSTAVEMIDMVRRTRNERSTAPTIDLKLGAGGIREAEFFVQSLQLIWGGRDRAVRSTNTLEGLRRLRMRGYVTERETRQVRDAYLLLRRAEHRIQLASGIQTHLLPLAGAERDRLAHTMGYASGIELTAALDRCRTRVSARLSSLAPTAGEPSSELVDLVLNEIDSIPPPQHDEASMWQLDGSLGSECPPSPTEMPAAKVVPPAGSTPPDPAPPLALPLLQAFRALARKPRGPLGGVTRERNPQFARKLVSRILDAADPEQAARLVNGFFDRLAAASVGAYVRAFEADDRALSRFVSLCGASAYLGGLLVGRPELADWLLFTHPEAETTARALCDAELARLCDQRSDPEELIGALRRAKNTLELDVGLRDLAGELGPRDSGRLLTAMADATLNITTDLVLSETGRALGLAEPLPGLAVLAMGKLGGREIGYGSDLDVVFIYDPDALEGTGLDPLEMPELYARVAQRIIRLIGTPHGAGRGYELDTRLRPSGEQGLLVVSLGAFRSYHLERSREVIHAAEWERQALVRLRPCAGDAAVADDAAAIAAIAAFGEPTPALQMGRLRLRMERELAHERPGRCDVKLGRGGLADIEFAVQYLQMAHGSDPSVRTPETVAAIDALEAGGHLGTERATLLRDAYRFIRRIEQRIRIVHDARLSLLDEGAPGVRAVARSMGFRDGPGRRAEDQLFSRYQMVASDVRTTFCEVLGIPESELRVR